jgi:hypothetical protein
MYSFRLSKGTNVLVARITLVYSIANMDMLYESQSKELRFSSVKIRHVALTSPVAKFQQVNEPKALNLRTPMCQGGRSLLVAASDRSLPLDEGAMFWVFVISS